MDKCASGMYIVQRVTEARPCDAMIHAAVIAVKYHIFLRNIYDNSTPHVSVYMLLCIKKQASKYMNSDTISRGVCVERDQVWEW